MNNMCHICKELNYGIKEFIPKTLSWSQMNSVLKDGHEMIAFLNNK
jgi:hypothetical protein